MDFNVKRMFLLACHLLLFRSDVFGLTDSEIILKFKNSLSNASALGNWGEELAPCELRAKRWNGVICVNGSIRGLQLENMGLRGKIDVETLENLPLLRALSFMNNSFEGPMPNFTKLGALRAIYLSNNYFSGEIPEHAFAGMVKLTKVHLANNEFTGPIPSSLTRLPRLVGLRLEGNRFTGPLPSFTQNFRSFNVSNNKLEGPIPASLAHIADSTSFSGNNRLCAPPLKDCNYSSNTPLNSTTLNSARNSISNITTTHKPTSNSSSGSNDPKNSSLVAITTTALIVGAALVAIIASAFILLRRQQQTSVSMESPPCHPPPNFQAAGAAASAAGFKEGAREGACGSPENSGSNKKPNNTKLSFITNDRDRFDLQDLLKASAEILGSGPFGSSYKAALLTGQVMVVKRYKQMNNVGKEEFQEHMRRLGRLRHSNILPLVAYYYRKEEKLLVSDFVENGSLAAHLHGQPSLDWKTRLKIVKGVAKGLAHLHEELPCMIAAHGHLKSSNVLLNASCNPLLTDYGLVPVINQENAQEHMVAYKSPEYLQHGRITRKTDVWSLGVLILDILTGTNGAKPSGVEDLAGWVSSMPAGDWTDRVVDKEMGMTKTNECDILKLMEIGLWCCVGDVDKRMDMKDATERIDEFQETAVAGDDHI